MINLLSCISAVLSLEIGWEERLRNDPNLCRKKAKGCPYSITELRVPELIPVLGSQHKPGGWLPLLSARPAVTPATLNRAALPLSLLGEQRHDECEQFA